MRDIAPLSDAAQASDGERTTLLAAYVLDALAPLTGFLAAIVSVIISHIKVGETRNTFIRNHHRWLIRTFWWNLLWCVIFGMLTIVFIGFIGLFAMLIWWLYRVIRGLIAYSNGELLPE
ncbi:Uncharacterized membrane protein [Fontimonas thermophila]|uniref:Uncharacterized membrane protein n=1 Tax=Fontimonas thermophila TaxID=1076937 RepID=A0A1I2KG52_9GAMM|nr:hypothetical protein [Fontimonas thermophila]SFF65433.1 Uncharacterized membrane protein [Fontimonas thermophila]